MNRGTNTQFFQPQGKTSVERPLQRPPTKVWSLTKCERASEKNHQHRGMRSRAKAGEERTKEPSVHAKWKVREGRHSMPRIMNTRQRTPTKIPGPRQGRAKRKKGTKGPRGPKSRAVRQTLRCNSYSRHTIVWPSLTPLGPCRASQPPMSHLVLPVFRTSLHRPEDPRPRHWSQMHPVVEARGRGLRENRRAFAVQAGTCWRGPSTADTASENAQASRPATLSSAVSTLFPSPHDGAEGEEASPRQRAGLDETNKQMVGFPFPNWYPSKRRGCAF